MRPKVGKKLRTASLNSKFAALEKKCVSENYFNNHDQYLETIFNRARLNLCYFTLLNEV